MWQDKYSPLMQSKSGILHLQGFAHDAKSGCVGSLVQNQEGHALFCVASEFHLFLNGKQDFWFRKPKKSTVHSNQKLFGKLKNSFEIELLNIRQNINFVAGIQHATLCTCIRLALQYL